MAPSLLFQLLSAAAAREAAAAVEVAPPALAVSVGDQQTRTWTSFLAWLATCLAQGGASARLEHLVPCGPNLWPFAAWCGDTRNTKGARGTRARGDLVLPAHNLNPGQDTCDPAHFPARWLPTVDELVSTRRRAPTASSPAGVREPIERNECSALLCSCGAHASWSLRNAALRSFCVRHQSGSSEESRVCLLKVWRRARC